MIEREGPVFVPGQFRILKELIDREAFDPASKNIVYYRAERAVEEVMERSKSGLVFDNGGVEVGRRALRQVIKEIVDSGLVKAAVARRAGESIRPSGMEFSQGASYFESKLSQPGGLWLMDTICWGRIASKKGLAEAAEAVGVGLPWEIGEKIRQKADAGHEYGHGILTSLERAFLAKQLKEEEREAVYSKLEWREIYRWARYVVLGEVNEVSPLEKTVVGELLERGMVGEEEIISAQEERVAMGFEFVSIKSALVKEGVESAKAEKMRDYLISGWRRGGEEMAELMGDFCQRGMGFLELSGLLRKLSAVLISKGRSDLAAIVRPKITGTDLGYCFGLKEEELKRWLTRMEEMTGEVRREEQLV